MGRENYYKPGSFYRVCDRTGFTTRAERTRKEWDGLIVRDISWEARQPQDWVKGVRDDQTVPEARPRPVPTFGGPAQSTLIAGARAGARYVLVTAPFPFAVGNKLAITINADLGIVFYCAASGSSGSDFNLDFNQDFSSLVGGGVRVGITPPLAGPASAGNWIANLSAPEVQPSSYGPSNGG